MNYHGLIEILGNTPIVRLEEVFPRKNYGFDLYAKMEWLNPGGSAKDRSAVSMLLHAYNNLSES